MVLREVYLYLNNNLVLTVSIDRDKQTFWSTANILLSRLILDLCSVLFDLPVSPEVYMVSNTPDMGSRPSLA